jgi:hypothetical protein
MNPDGLSKRTPDPASFRIQDKDVSDVDSQSKQLLPKQTPSPPFVSYENALALLNNAFIEFLATTVLLYSTIYVPHFMDDPLAQLIPGLAIVAMMMTLKDRMYFCPDGSFMITLTLLCAGAYTRATEGKTWRERISSQWGATYGQLPDVMVRIVGQMAACYLVYNVMVVKFRQDMGSVPYHQIWKHGNSTHHTDLNVDILCMNEFISTAIEYIAASFCIMPLLRPYMDKRDSNTQTVKDENIIVTFSSKTDTAPPTNKNLFNAAISIAIMHVVLDRLFRTTMNPFVFYMHCEIMGQDCLFGDYWTVYVAQLGGLAVAGLYSYCYLPKPEVLSAIFESKT